MKKTKELRLENKDIFEDTKALATFLARSGLSCNQVKVLFEDTLEYLYNVPFKKKAVRLKRK